MSSSGKYDRHREVRVRRFEGSPGDPVLAPDRVVDEDRVRADADDQVDVSIGGTDPGDHVAVLRAIVMGRVIAPVPGRVGSPRMGPLDLGGDLLGAGRGLDPGPGP